MSLQQIITQPVTAGRYDKIGGLIGILTALVSIVWAGHILSHTFLGDSGIYLIYAKNILMGAPLTFNTDQFSSGSTSPIWPFFLAPAFLFKHSFAAVKIISLIATLIATTACYAVCSVIARSWVAGAFAMAFALYFIPMAGLQGFESPLIATLVSLLIWINYRYFENEQTKGNLRWLIVIWALIPLARIDATSIIFFNFLVLLWYHRHDHKQATWDILRFAISLLPAALYFGYSKLTLGSFSVSSYCRAFKLKEFSSATLFGHPVSWSLIQTLFTSRACYWVWFAIIATLVFKFHRKYPWLIVLTALAVTCYIIMLTFIAPVSGDIYRYSIPLVPLISVMIALGASHTQAFLRQRLPYSLFQNYIFAAILAAAILYFLPTHRLVKQSSRLAVYGYTPNTIFEKNIADYLNKTIPVNSTVLAYEVQIRLFLRPDINVLSLDGITDGKVAPYLASANMTDFLKQYKPQYWIANAAVFYRSFLKPSILNEVVQKTGSKVGSQITIDGITFTNIKKRTKPDLYGFAGYTQIYRLSYAE